jgi:hypothetical protein
MWLEIDVMLSGSSLDWEELGLEVKHEFVRRMVRLQDIAYVQELVNDIQIIIFYDKSSCFVRGSYQEIRDEILHLDQEEDDL